MHIEYKTKKKDEKIKIILQKICQTTKQTNQQTHIDYKTERKTIKKRR